MGLARLSHAGCTLSDEGCTLSGEEVGILPMLSVAELLEVIPRWPENSDGIEAPEGICGDWQCECANVARRVLTAGEYQLAFGVPKEYGLDTEG
jgi:hypothetical protein